MFRLSTLLAVAALATSTVAQDIIPVTKISYGGRYDIASETFYPSIDGQKPAGDATGTVIYDNSAFLGSFSTGSGAVKTHHFMDWGTPNYGGSGAVIESLEIGYATNVTVAQGTVNLRLRLYDGATGFGVKGTVVGDYLLTGLPNSSSGGYEGWSVTVTLPAPLAVNDGAFGWSYNSDAAGATNSTGPLLVGPPNPDGIINAYDRYLETTDAYVNTFSFAAPTVASFYMVFFGRFNNPPVNPWENYGDTKNKVTLEGSGSATPGSVDNNLHLSHGVPTKPLTLVVGLTQSDILKVTTGVHFYALPWVLMVGPLTVNPVNGDLDIPAPFDPALIPGTEIYMQAFGQNLANVWKNYSFGLKVTVQ